MTHQQAIAKYGLDVCIKAYRMSKAGEGPRSIALTVQGLNTTSQADRAIDAGRWLLVERGAVRVESA